MVICLWYVVDDLAVHEEVLGLFMREHWAVREGALGLSDHSKGL